MTVLGERREGVSYWMYILASRPRGTLYVGVTNDLVRRVAEHRDGAVPGFTKAYNVKTLVYFEEHESVLEAIKREKQVKRWARSWKIDLIRKTNPDWRDLFDEIV
jgi:putative endonuclease